MRGDGLNRLQIPVPLPLKNIFRMIPLSAQSISLDSPFNVYNLFEKEKTTLKVKNSGSGLVAALPAHYGKNSGSVIADQR